MDNSYKNYKRLEKQVLDSYDEELHKIGYILEKNVILKDQYYIEIDGLIKNKKGNLLAIIEVKSILNEYAIKSVFFRERRILNYINCRYMIITNGNSNRLYYLDNDGMFIDCGFFDNELATINHLKFLINKGKIENRKKEIEYKLKGECFNLECINDLFRLNNDFIEIEDNKYSFSKKIEDKIFKKLINDKEGIEIICRYTTLESLFSIIKNGTFRMNGICGMNDKTEVNYLEDYIYEEKKEWYITKSNKEKEQINNTFITSCCDETKIDDLTQWRLYADDAKGVCLVFDLNKDKLKKFLFGKIIYRKEELDILKRIIQIVKEIEPNSMFVFKTLPLYKHFFKPSDYEVEQEIRLVYLHNKNNKNNKIKKDWVIAQPYNIIDPYIEFNLFDNQVEFPLKLKEIILGPKCSEKEINKIQLENLLEEKNFNNIKVRCSEIKHYR